jgi:hypothetical protein
MKLEDFLGQGFKLLCKMYPSDKYKQGIDIDFTKEIDDTSVPGVYILTNSKEEILKIGQSSHIGNRFNRMYKCISNTTNNKVRSYIRDCDIIWVYTLPMAKLKHIVNIKGKDVKLETSFASSLEKHLLKEYRETNNSLPVLNSGLS